MPSQPIQALRVGLLTPSYTPEGPCDHSRPLLETPNSSGSFVRASKPPAIWMVLPISPYPPAGPSDTDRSLAAFQKGLPTSPSSPEGTLYPSWPSCRAFQPLPALWKSLPTLPPPGRSTLPISTPPSPPRGPPNPSRPTRRASRLLQFL